MFPGASWIITVADNCLDKDILWINNTWDSYAWQGCLMKERVTTREVREPKNARGI